MSVELHWFYESENGVNGRQELDTGEVAWSSGYGDGHGNETCVIAQEGDAHIFRGTVSPTMHDGEPHDEVTDIDDAGKTELLVGEPRVERLLNHRGDILLLCARNLGECRQYPGMRPAWN